MIYKALVSFAGNNISMRRNETRDIKDSEVTDNLVKAGYLAPVESESTGVSDKPKSAKRSSKAAKSKES